MTTNNTTDVFHKGIWVDHDLPLLLGSRVLVREWWLFFWISFLSVWIAVWAPRYWDLVKTGIPWAIRQARLYGPRAWMNDEPGDLRSDWYDDDLLPSASEIPLVDIPVAPLLMESRTAEEGAVDMVGAFMARQARPIRLSETTRTEGRALISQRIKIKLRERWQHLQKIWGDFVLIAVMVSFCATIFVGIAAAATAVVHLEMDNMAVFNSPHCGIWVHESEMKNTAAWRGRIAERTDRYYRECYESDPSQQECNLFSSRELHVTMTENEECPFRGDMCSLGKDSAITLDTGYLDSKYLGINARWRPLVRRRSICAPIVTEGYSETINGSILSLTSFYYGSVQNRNRTFSRGHIVNTSGIYTPTYSVFAISEGAGFHPIEELTSDKGDTVLIFVEAFGIPYSEPSKDPIFPANDIPKGPCPNLEPCWVNSLNHATVLGCVELIEICTPALDACFDPRQPVGNTSFLHSPGDKYAIIPVILAMNLTNFGVVIDARGGQSLDATRRLANVDVSLPLEKEQWKLEARRLFEMSILRAKMELINFARGPGADQAGFVNILPPIFNPACRLIKAQAKGYRNLSLFGMLAAAVGPPLIGQTVRHRPLIWWISIGIWKVVMLTCWFLFLTVWSLTTNTARVLYGLVRSCLS